MPAGQTLESAKVYYALNQANNTNNRTVSLYPLTRTFVEGNGQGKGSGPSGGATWDTYDGTNAWTTAGGDYDATTHVDAAEGDTWFSWDITSLWDNTNLRSYGALLCLSNESYDLSDLSTPNDSMPRVAFNSAQYTPAGYAPYIEVITAVPEPATIVLLASGCLCLPALLPRRKQ